MHSIYFIGPTLAGKLPKPLKGELWLPPAGQGDVLNTFLCYNPKQIILIDGEFRQRLAVWVKELVYIMAQGCRFIGAASMGALRAAELHRFGAVGIGKIFSAYRDGFADESWVACEYHPVTYAITRGPPCGIEAKEADALEAIEFARNVPRGTQPVCKFNKEELMPILAPVIDRILSDSLLLTESRDEARKKLNKLET
jgi:hypothetical protein